MSNPIPIKTSIPIPIREKSEKEKELQKILRKDAKRGHIASLGAPVA